MIITKLPQNNTFEADRPERTHDMKKYFNVSYQYSESVYCANIAHAESAEAVEAVSLPISCLKAVCLSP